MSAFRLQASLAEHRPTGVKTTTEVLESKTQQDDLHATVEQMHDGVAGNWCVVLHSVNQGHRLRTTVALAGSGERPWEVLEVVSRHRSGLDTMGDEDPPGYYLLLRDGTRILLEAALDALQEALATPREEPVP